MKSLIAKEFDRVMGKSNKRNGVGGNLNVEILHDLIAILRNENVHKST